MSERRLLRLSGHAFRSGRFDKAVLPIGSTEYHGEHLPHGTDTLVAEALAEALAERVEGLLVLPTLPYGMSRHYYSFPMAVSLTTNTLMAALREIFQSLYGHGIKRLLIINGHDGNIPAIDAAAREFRAENPEMRIAVLEAWWETAARLLPEGTFEAWGGLGHGGEGETSMALAIAPELVEMEYARGVTPKLPPHVQVKWRFDELTPYGVTGDPTKATAEKGRLMMRALVELLTSFIKEMDERNWEIEII
jgi:creatinine amidohydrolase